MRQIPDTAQVPVPAIDAVTVPAFGYSLVQNPVKEFAVFANLIWRKHIQGKHVSPFIELVYLCQSQLPGIGYAKGKKLLHSFQIGKGFGNGIGRRIHGMLRVQLKEDTVALQKGFPRMALGQ